MLWFYDTPGFDAVCADPHPFYLAVLNSADPLKVGIPSGFRLVMGMTYIIAYDGFFPANFTHF